jgi:antitoxin (DNA-binding transcriptional repressor) of toxin-antitoxin stability system
MALTWPHYQDKFIAMSVAVKIGELKNRLSHYLRKVRAGESVLVYDRDRIIARIDPVHDAARLGEDENARTAELVRRGVLAAPRQRSNKAWVRSFLAELPDVDADVVSALLDEREHGR